MAINKVIYSGETLIDLTGDTVTPQSLARGYTAHNKSGIAIVGTYDALKIVDEQVAVDYSIQDSYGQDIYDSQYRVIEGQKIYKLA